MNSVLQNHFTGNKAGEINKNLFWYFYWNSVILFAFLRLCIKPGIQERGTECRNAENGSYITGNVVKHSGECPQTFQGMYSNIPGNVAKHSGECPKTLCGMPPSILGNVAKHSGQCTQTFREISPNIGGNIGKRSEECSQTFWGMSPNIPGIVAKRYLIYLELISAFEKLHQLYRGL